MKPGAKPNAGAVARPGGGFRSGFGSFNEAHLEEQAFQAASQQKQLGQQATSAAQASTGGSALQPQGSGSETVAEEVKQQKPRDVVNLGDGALKEELIKRPLQDIGKELAAFFDLNALLGIKPGDTPEQQAKKKQLLNRWQGLNQEQQQVAQKKYQEDMQKKQLEEEEKAQKKQAEEQQEAQTIMAPSSPQKGPIGPGGSKKQRATQQLQQSRQSIGKVQGAN